MQGEAPAHEKYHAAGSNGIVPSLRGRRALPGQFVLFRDDVNLGIAIYSVRQGEGTRFDTRFRDETAGTLDPANGKEYVRLLRRPINLSGWRQVFFICHMPLAWELAGRELSAHHGRVLEDYGEVSAG
jgi:hypothetical protein